MLCQFFQMMSGDHFKAFRSRGLFLQVDWSVQISLLSFPFGWPSVFRSGDAPTPVHLLSTPDLGPLARSIHRWSLVGGCSASSGRRFAAKGVTLTPL